MAINIESMTFDDEGACYHAEDLVLITGTSNRLLILGLAPRDLAVIGAPLAA